MNQTNLPTIAIVGRPNVGKSTLFNRIIGKRVAIEAKEARTTRDRLTSKFFWRNQNFILVDTAGLINSTNEILTESVKATNMAIEQSDLILFTVDFKEGPTEADLKLAKVLRKNRKAVILAVNKCDNIFHNEQKNQFKRLGFENIVLVSAISGKNTGDLLDLVHKLTQKPTEKSTEINHENDISVSIIGRPNVGKSTLLNKIINQNRMIVSSVPNTTRDSQDSYFKFKNKNLKIIDTAGLNKKTKNDRNTVESFAYLRSINAIKNSSVIIYVLDAEQKITSFDLNIIGQAKEFGKSILIAVNKCDLWKENLENNMLKTISALQDKLNFMPYVPIVFISAQKRTHLINLLDQVLKVYDERNFIPDQKIVNQIFQQSKNSQSGFYYFKNLKFEKTNPPVFKLFIYKNKKPHFSHLRYLENKIRDIYPYIGTPIFIDWVKQ